ncbi:MAG: endonuclease/exonuclease/phosphatase family protein [Oligoflexia bacterium]|nr:endonuclease/exonuclease/phosphatase family protein [Oligoflexia bacterium]
MKLIVVILLALLTYFPSALMANLQHDKCSLSDGPSLNFFSGLKATNPLPNQCKCSSTPSKDDLTSTHNSTLRVMSFNILGDIWLDPNDYRPSMRPFLTQDVRNKAIDSVITKTNPDALCLQEVTATSYQHLKNQWSKQEYHVLPFAPHTNNYWKQYLAPGKEYMDHGNAIMLRKSRFAILATHTHQLSSDGNTALLVLAQDQRNKQKILIVASHLDAEAGSDVRISQSKELVHAINHYKDGDNTVVIMGSDMNDGNPSDWPIHSNLWKSDMTNAWEVCKVEHRTHPFDNSGEPMVIDHIYASNNTKIIESCVVDEIPQEFTGEKRFEDALKRYGSDHFPIMADIDYRATI